MREIERDRERKKLSQREREREREREGERDQGKGDRIVRETDRQDQSDARQAVIIQCNSGVTNKHP